MTITNHRGVYSLSWKGFQYGKKTSVNDQITTGSGKTSLKNRSTSPSAIFRPTLSTRLYPGPTVRDISSSAIFQHRLSRHCQGSRRFLRHPKSAEHEKNTALYNPAKGSTEAAKKNVFQGLLGKIFDRARACGLIKPSSSHTCCIDSTGLENHYVSRHFLKRQGRKTRKYRRWTKLTAVCENKSYLIASAVVSSGPGTDCHYLEPAVRQAIKHVPIATLLADSGFDAEYNHRLCRDKFGIRSTVIKVNDRNLKYNRTKGFFRRKMKERFPAKKYRQRWQIEAVFSRFKRRLGNALTARTDISRTAECLLRVLT